MIEEQVVEIFAKRVRENEKDRIEFCKNVGITLDDYYVKQCGDFEIEDMIRAYNNGKAGVQQELTEMNKSYKKFRKDYQELCRLKDMRIEELKAEIKSLRHQETVDMYSRYPC